MLCVLLCSAIIRASPCYPPPPRAAPWLDLYRAQKLLFLMFVLSDSGAVPSGRRGGGEENPLDFDDRGEGGLFGWTGSLRIVHVWEDTSDECEDTCDMSSH